VRQLYTIKCYVFFVCFLLRFAITKFVIMDTL